MKTYLVVTLLATGFVLCPTAPARPHHSHAMFDHLVEVTITGTVTAFSFRNPHVFLYLDAEGENGEVVSWAIEMSNIGNTIRRGIGGSTFKPGDVITVTVNPLKNGRPGGNFTSISTPDGKTY